MAEEKNKQENQNFFTNLKKFFASSIVIKYTDDTEKIKVFDINSLQTIKNVETNRLIDKYFSLYKSGYNLLGDMSTTGFSTMRADLYRNYECLAGNTIIPTPDKEPNKTIQELSELYPNKDTRFYVYSYDKESDSIKLGVAHSVRKTKTDQTYKIVFDNGKNLIATSDHPILMRNGEYKLVKDLQINDSVMPFYEKDFEYNQKIKSIEKYEIIDVYDITVDTYHNFATENCFVHNCMDQDAVISAVLDLLSEEGSMPNEYGEVIAVNSEKEYIQKTLENLLYDVLNIEFNLPWWIRNLAKYGDFFMKLDIVETIGITNCIPLSVYGVERLEDFNNPALVRFSYDDALATNLVSYSNILANIRRQTFEQYEIAHFRLLADSNYLPYGRSYIEGARKIWNQLTLMIDAMMLQRIMRAPERRVFKIDVGTLAPDQVPAHMEKIISKLKKVPYIDETTGNYNLKFSLQTALEDFYLPVRGDKSGTSIETLPGMPPPPVNDLDFLEQRLYTALKIPKAFLANEESVNAKSTLASQDMRLARTIDRFHKIIVNELTKICVVHLYTQGYRDDDLIDFELEMFSPSTTYQLEKIELLDKKTDLAGKMKESKLFSDKFIYNTIYNMSDSEAAEEEEGIIYDLKKNWRHEQIGEGSDPASEMKLSASDYSSPEGGSSTNLGIETEEMSGEETSETEEGAEESTNKEETPPEEVGLKPKPEEEKESPESSVDKSLIDQEKEEDENEVDDEIEKARIARSRLKDKKQVKSTTLIGRKVSSLTKADENNPNIPAHNRNRTIYGNTVKREDFNKSGKKILKEYNDIGTFMDEERLENFK